jgi:hypothetical protein
VHKRLTIIFAVVLLLASIFYWSGWLIWAIAFYITRRHPPVQRAERELSRSRRLLAWTALAIFLLTAMHAPFAGGGFLDIRLHQ